jgi:hypothetical protein
MNAQAVSTKVGAFTKSWRGAPPVRVVETPSDLPIKRVPLDARGMFRGGEVWVVASTQGFNSPLRTFVHEAVGHHGLRELLGSGWAGFMGGLSRNTRNLQGDAGEVAQHIRHAYRDDSGHFNLSALEAADEVSANLAEYVFSPSQGRLVIEQPLKKQASAVAGHFAREVLYFDAPVTENQLEGTLLQAEHFVRHGGLFWGLARRLRDWYYPPMALDRYKPPMSMAESEELLRAADSHEDNVQTSKMFLHIGTLLILLGFVVWSVISMVMRLF